MVSDQKKWKILSDYPCNVGLCEAKLLNSPTLIVIVALQKGQSNFSKKDITSILKDDFPSRKDPPIFTSKAPDLLIGPVKWNKFSFLSIEINNHFHAPVHIVPQATFKFRKQV